MKIRRFTAYCIFMLMLIAVLCACGSNAGDPEQTDPTVSTSGPNTQPAEESTPRSDSLEDLYEKTEIDHIFKLNSIDTDNYYVVEAQLHDGYILLLMQDFSEPGEGGVQYVLDSGKILLFPVNRPDFAVSLEVDQFTGSYTLLAGGTVLSTDWDGSYTIYNSSLEEVHRENTDCGTFLGASDQGDIWYLTDDSSFVLYRDGKQVQTVHAEGMVYGSYIGSRGGKAYFAMVNHQYEELYVTIDMQNLSCSESPMLYNHYDFSNGLFCYSSEDKWYIAGMEDPYTVTAFTKPYSDEIVWGMDEKYLIGEAVNYDAASETLRQDFRIYDMRSGGLCEERSSSELSEYGISLLDYDQGLILFDAHDEDLAAKGLYLWDISHLAAEEPAKTYETIDYHVDRNRIDALIREINDQYGVSIYYDAEHLQAYSESYNLIECSDEDLIGYTLVKLKECMAEYPEGFFEELKGESIHDVVFCLCDAHDRTFEYTIEDAAATVTTIENTLRMSIDVHYWNGLRRIFLHENTHMVSSRLQEELEKVSSRYYVEYWFNELNSPECPLMQSFIWAQTEENLKGVYDLDPDNAWFIDWYSKCTVNEDEARTMENGIYSASARYYTSPHIDRKSRFLNAIIREAFPCVKNSQEEVFWEQRTGIVDLYQEFPDFIV